MLHKIIQMYCSIDLRRYNKFITHIAYGMLNHYIPFLFFFVFFLDFLLFFCPFIFLHRLTFSFDFCIKCNIILKQCMFHYLLFVWCV